MPRKEGPPWTWPAPWRSRSSLSFPLGLALPFSYPPLSSLPRFFSLTLSRSSSTFCPHAPVKGTKPRAPSEKEGAREEGADWRSREESSRRRRSRRSGEDKVSFYSPPGTRSVPFHGAASRSRARLRFVLSPASTRIAQTRVRARIRSYERTRACGTRTRRAWREKRERERGKEGKKETVASLVLRRPRALHSTQRRANPMGP